MPSLTTKLVTCACLISTGFISACSSELFKDDVIKDNAIHLTAGDKVRLVKTFKVKALYSHVIFQDGEIINEVDLNPYRVSCIFDVYDLGPAAYAPEEFSIADVTYNEEMYSDSGAVVRYFTEFYFDSFNNTSPSRISSGRISPGSTNTNTKETQNILTCQVLDDTTQYHPFPISEIKQATGHYFHF